MKKRLYPFVIAALVIATQAFSSTPEATIRTPAGIFPASCVRNVGNNARVSASGEVTYANGTHDFLPSCPLRQKTSNRNYTPPSSWVMDSIASSPTPSVHMTATFVVPSVPTSSDGQTVFFFPGMRPADGSSVLQPVLQWGNGTPSWQIASWSCAAVSGGPCPSSDLVAVNPGDEIHGEILGSNCTGSGQCDWTITTKDNSTGQSTTLNTTDDNRSYVLLFGGVLESYGVGTCDDYPSNGKILFSQVSFYDVAANLLVPNWAPQYDVTDYCNLAIHTTATTTELDFTNGS